VGLEYLAVIGLSSLLLRWIPGLKPSMCIKFQLKFWPGAHSTLIMARSAQGQVGGQVAPEYPAAIGLSSRLLRWIPGLKPCLCTEFHVKVCSATG
jgi:hypothetical protein